MEHTEKTPVPSKASPAVDEANEAKKGYTLDVAFREGERLKVAEDGHTVLIPQPTDDPEDPLNWPRKKKLSILFTMSMIAFLPEFGSAAGIPAIVPQSVYVRMWRSASLVLEEA